MKRARTIDVFALTLLMFFFVVACVATLSTLPCGAFSDQAVLEDDGDDGILSDLMSAHVSVWNLDRWYQDKRSNRKNCVTYFSGRVSAPILFLLI
jgi:hypothetical protein